MIWAFFLLGAW